MSSCITTSGIGWSQEKLYEYSLESTKKLIDSIRDTNKLPLSDGDIRFSDDYWDFSSLTTLNIDKAKLKFNFKDVIQEYKDEIKLYVLIKLIEGDNKIQTIYRKYISMKNFFRYMGGVNIYSLKLVNCEDIELYFKMRMEKRGVSFSTILQDKVSINDYYKFYSCNIEDIYSQDIKESLKLQDTGLIKAYKENHKLNAIPARYFNILLSIYIKVMRNKSYDNNKRGFACIMIIESQTGIRASDLTSIEINQVYSEELINGKGYYLNYATSKRAKGNNSRDWVFTFINELSYEAYNTLIEIYGDYRKTKGTKLLYTPIGSELPVVSRNLITWQRNFVFKYHNELNSINNETELEGLSKVSVRIIREKISQQDDIKELKNSDMLYYPITHQFRVNLCTELYHKGVPLAYIKKYMTHLSSEMEDYYVRPKKNYQENIIYSKNILKDIISGDIKPLGKNVTSLTDKINEFIGKNKFNVAKDINEIVDELIKKIPVRAKSGGVCIKSSILRDCSKDAKTDKFYCAYGVCPNHFHFFYMADITYQHYEILKKSYDYNKINGFIRQSEKEKIKIKNIINDMLIPELDELRNEFKLKGKEHILKKYPKLDSIIINYNNIYKEVERWIK